jgi:myo-inositol catabolism protein IolC
MVTDTTTDAQLRRTIQKTIEQEMPLRLLERIVYEVRCEEMGIRPDGWKLYPEEN